MYDSARGALVVSLQAELDLRNGQQLAEASVTMSRVTRNEKLDQHFEQLADTLCQATNDVADLLRKTEAAGADWKLQFTWPLACLWFSSSI